MAHVVLRTCLSVLLTLVLLSGSASADVYADAIAAMDRGETPTVLRLMQPLADGGDARARHIIGNAYFERRDYPEAVKWYRLAADQGDALAQVDLGEMCLSGHGVPQDYVEAYMWFNLAAASDEDAVMALARAARDDVARVMTPEQIADAQTLSREWKPKQ
jgi:uncharacterized protein